MEKFVNFDIIGGVPLNIFSQFVETSFKHCTSCDLEEGGDNREGSGLDKGERGQLIIFFKTLFKSCAW